MASTTAIEPPPATDSQLGRRTSRPDEKHDVEKREVQHRDGSSSDIEEGQRHADEKYDEDYTPNVSVLLDV
jgi:hypothetical protein